MDLKEFKKELFKERPDVKEEYEKTKQSFNIAKKIMKARIDKGLTQSQLAKLIDTKQPSIARIESGAHSINLKTLQKISRVLGVKFLDLEHEKSENSNNCFSFALPFYQKDTISSIFDFQDKSLTSTTKNIKLK